MGVSVVEWTHAEGIAKNLKLSTWGTAVIAYHMISHHIDKQ
jgi:hypothetical protein